MALTAADLQKRHELEGAPDPFPSLADSIPSKTRSQAPANLELDTGSQLAFPSLASATPAVVSATKPAWGAAAGPRIGIKPSTIKSDSFTLGAIDLSNTGKDGKPATLGEIMKQVMVKYKVKLEASANQKTRQTTFHIKAETQKELDKAKRSLLALLSPTITLIIHAPVSTIGSIIGPKGEDLQWTFEAQSCELCINPSRTITVIRAEQPRKH